MGLGFLPTVSECCFSLPLKIGCIIICIVTCFIASADAGTGYGGTMSGQDVAQEGVDFAKGIANAAKNNRLVSKARSGFFNSLSEFFCTIIFLNRMVYNIMKFLLWAKTLVASVTIIAAVVFFIGIFANLQITCVIFVIACLSLGVIKVLMSIINILGPFIFNYFCLCPKSKIFGMEIVNILQAVVLIYFAAVADSYSDEMS